MAIDRDPQLHEHEGKIAPLLSHAREQIESPPGNDQIIAAFNMALVENSHTPHMKSVLELAAFEDDPSYAINKLLRCFQKQLLFRESTADFEYPQAFMPSRPDLKDAAGMWNRAIEAIIDDEESSSEVYEDFLVRQTQSNIVQRYSMLKMLMHLTADRFGDSLDVVDIGCSQNLGLKKIALNRPFDAIDIYKYVKGREKLADPETAEALNFLLEQAVAFGKGTGIDIFNAETREVIEWAQACSFYPSELLYQPGLLTEFSILEEKAVPNVGFIQADVTSESIRNNRAVNRAKIIPEKASITFASTMLYMLSERERTEVYEVMELETAANGIQAVLDFVRIDRNGKLVFSGPSGKKDQFALIIKDNLNPRHNWQEIARIQDGRVHCLRMSTGKIALHGRLISPRDAVRKVAADF